MANDYASLLKRLERRRADRYRRTSMNSRDREFGGPYPPAPRSVVVTAEETLGFQLPPLLREIYGKLANGGFGPGYGLLGLAGGYSVDDLEDMSLDQYYLSLRAFDEELHWPEQLLPCCYLGCQGTYSVDCSKTDYPVIQTDFGSLLEPTFTFDELMERWADGKE